MSEVFRCWQKKSGGTPIPVPEDSPGFDRSPAEPTRRVSRRVGESVLIAFNEACKRNHLELAAQLLVDYERLVTRLPITLGPDRRLEIDGLISAHAKLWTLLGAHLSE